MMLCAYSVLPDMRDQSAAHLGPLPRQEELLRGPDQAAGYAGLTALKLFYQEVLVQGLAETTSGGCNSQQ